MTQAFVPALLAFAALALGIVLNFAGFARLLGDPVVLGPVLIYVLAVGLPVVAALALAQRAARKIDGRASRFAAFTVASFLLLSMVLVAVVVLFLDNRHDPLHVPWESRWAVLYPAIYAWFAHGLSLQWQERRRAS